MISALCYKGMRDRCGQQENCLKNSPEEGRSGGTGRGGGTKQQQPLAPKELSWQVGPKSWHLPPSRLHADSKACVFQRVLNSGWIRNYKANSVSSDLEL